MKSKEEIQDMLSANYKTLESNLDIQIRNGQCSKGIKKALEWVLK